MTEYQILLLNFTPRPIHSSREYRRALNFIEQHMQPRPPKGAAELLELLSTLVVDYESRTYPEPDVTPDRIAGRVRSRKGVAIN
ncbi:MAG: hypothetical protein WD851_22290 [Pirellulales bacterium]